MLFFSTYKKRFKPKKSFHIENETIIANTLRKNKRFTLDHKVKVLNHSTMLKFATILFSYPPLSGIIDSFFFSIFSFFVSKIFQTTYNNI